MLEQQIINGILFGATYAILTLGYTLVFGSLKMLNLAHGDTFMLGAFLGLTIGMSTNVPFVVILAVAMLGAGIIGVLVYFFSFKFVSKEHELASFVSTISLGIAFQTIATKIWGSEPSKFPERFTVTDFHFGSILVSSVDVLIVAITAILLASLYLFLKHTSHGKAMRAISENATTATLLGINVNAIISLTFFISGALAGAAGVLIGLLYNNISPWMGVDIGLKGAAIMLLGGLGNVLGAVLGAFLIGILEILVVAYGSASYRDAVVYGALILILMLKPSGLFGAGSRQS